MELMKKLHNKIKLSKKGILGDAVNALSGFAIAFFVMIIVIFTVLKGTTAVKNTATETTIQNNMTAFLGSVGQFANYGDLVVVVGILAVVILLVSTAFPQRR
jgi:hypothetical protein